MAEVGFRIGHREYRVSAEDGEEKLLQRAAQVLNGEAREILAKVERIPEPRLLLLAGLMLADRYLGMEQRAEKAEAQLKRIQQNPAQVQVPVVPNNLKEAMAEFAARAESIASRLEEQQKDQPPPV